MTNRIKVAHIVGSLDVGGIEQWVCNLVNFETSNRNEVDFFILSMDSSRNKIVDRINLPKNRILKCGKRGIFYRLFFIFKFILKEKPDVIHTHPGYSSGLYSLISYLMKVRKIFVHSHSDRRRIDLNANFFRRLYIFLMKVLISKCASYNIAVSKDAGDSLFLSNYIVRYCGVPDFLSENVDVNNSELNDFIEKGYSLIFHVGRKSEAKNYPFIMELAEKLYDSNVIIVLVGSDLDIIKGEIEKNEIRNIYVFGFSESPAYLIKKYASLVILPSLWEGLPLSIVESQKVGKYCIVSENVTKECNIGGAEFLLLDANLWKERICFLLKNNMQFNVDTQRFSLSEDMGFYKKLWRGK